MPLFYSDHCARTVQQDPPETPEWVCCECRGIANEEDWCLRCEETVCENCEDKHRASHEASDIEAIYESFREE